MIDNSVVISKLFELEAQSLFKMDTRNINNPIPPQILVQQEHELYLRSYVQRVYRPEYSCSFRLDYQKKTNSYLVLGKTDSKLVMEVIVAAEKDKITKLQINTKPIHFYILQQDTKKVIQTYSIHKNRQIQMPLNNKLYQIKAVRNAQNQNNITQMVIINANIVKPKQKKNLNQAWLKQYEKKMNKFDEQATILFLDSLQSWDVISESAQKYIAYHSHWKIYTLIQMGLLVLLSIGQLIYLKKLLHSDVILI